MECLSLEKYEYIFVTNLRSLSYYYLFWFLIVVFKIDLIFYAGLGKYLLIFVFITFLLIGPYFMSE